MRCTYGPFVFPTKAAARTYFTTLLNEQGIVHDHDAILALTDLLQHHPQSKEKEGVGVDFFSVRRSPLGLNGSCFYITRLDGSCTDFSLKKCLAPSTIKTQVLRAMRGVVEEDIFTAKKAFFERHAIDGQITCPVTNSKVDWQHCHADHTQPNTFEVICQCFVYAKGYVWDTFPLEHRDESVTTVSSTIREQFRAYHNAIATIRLIQASHNCKIASAHRVRHDSTYLSLISTS